MSTRALSPLSEFEITPTNPVSSGCAVCARDLLRRVASADLEAAQTRAVFWNREEAGTPAAFPKTHVQLAIRTPVEMDVPGSHLSCLVCPEPLVIGVLNMRYPLASHAGRPSKSKARPTSPTPFPVVTGLKPRAL